MTRKVFAAMLLIAACVAAMALGGAKLHAGQKSSALDCAAQMKAYNRRREDVRQIVYLTNKAGATVALPTFPPEPAACR